MERHLRRALRLAARGRYRTSPNPRVGCVLVRDGDVVGEGWHRRVGGPHAEVEALTAAGDAARGATAYVTLEPCAHHGRTPPCTDALIDAGVARVVACHRDPNPDVAGNGFARLAAAGLDVTYGFLVEPAVRLNWRFLVAQVEGRPAVTLKWAMSLDGKIATAGGDSQWISTPRGRRWGLLEREEHDAILVGSGTALADDPRLDRRLGRASGPNVRVVVDRRLRLPPASRMLSLPGPVLIYAAAEAVEQRAERGDRLAAQGAEVVALETPTPPAVLADLHRRGVTSVLVEGGGTIAAAFVAAGLYDRVGVDCAPLLIGGRAAPGPLGGDGVEPLSSAPKLSDLKPMQRGEDVILIAFRESCLADLSKRVAA